MAAGFNQETRVLWYGPHAHVNPGKRREREYVLWPAYAWRVVAPKARKRPLNSLQKAVLEVLSSARLTAVELGGRLGIRPELAAFVVLELQGQGRMDREWNVTEGGKKVLQSEREQAAEMVAGWVFRDPWSGELWPYIAENLQQARTEPDEANNGFPQLDLGTTGRPWTLTPWMQFPPRDAASEAPDASEILRASMKMSRLERRSHRMGVFGGEEDDDDVPGGLDMHRIKAVETRHVPVFLTTFLYVPKDNPEEGMSWFAADFFGRGCDNVLRWQVERCAAEEPNFARVLDRLVGRTVYKGLSEYKEVVDALREKARGMIESAFTLDVRRRPIYEALLDAAFAWFEVREVGNRIPPTRYKALMDSIRAVLEGLFASIADDHPLEGMWRRLTESDRSINRVRLEAAATTLGFRTVPEVLWKMHRNQVKAACDFGKTWKLRPTIIATLLLAADEEEHPLRRAARRAPDLLVQIESVLELADPERHWKADGNGPDPGRLEEMMEKTLEIAGHLTGLPYRRIEVRHG